MEGKEVRFGQAMTALYAAVTTGLSYGGVNAMHDSLTPLGGLVPMFLIQLGEVLPGGVGSGLYGMLVFAILAVFVAGLMVGRTPEYLGKKIEAREMKFAMLALLILPLVDPRLHGGCGDAAGRRWRASPTPARTACPRSSMPIPRRPATTARPSPASPPTRPGTTRRSASPCCSAASPMSCRCWRSPARSPPRPRCPPPPAPSRPTRPLFVGLLDRRHPDPRRACNSSRRSRSGPIVEHFLMLAGKTF